MELRKLTVAQLTRLKAKIDAEIARRNDTAKVELLKEVKKMAAKAGVPMSELLGAKAGRRAAGTRKASPIKGKKVPPKYRNPANHAETWTGRGRQPAWVVKYVGSGKKLDNLLIK